MRDSWLAGRSTFSAHQRFPTCQGTPLVEWWMCLITLIPLLRSPLMVHTMPTKALLATTLRPLVVQLSSSLAHGARLIDHFLHQESTPQKMATFERELRTLLTLFLKVARKRRWTPCE